MPDLVVQASFNSGEWAPNLFARVDIQKYRSGAALLENFYVDYRGGASSRAGSKYVIQAYKSATAVRVISFQAAFNVGYVLEFGQEYLRFHFQGAPVLETGFSITGITQASPGVATVPGNNFAAGDWLFISGVLGMTQIDGRYVDIPAITGSAVSLGTLAGAPLDTSAFSAYTSGGQAQRIYTLTTPYAAGDLALLKFAQIQNEMVLTHPSYPPMLLTIEQPNQWTLTQISFGSTATAPANVAVTTTLGNGSANYSYVVTSLDASGQESEPSVPVSLLNKNDIGLVPASNSIIWTAAPGAVAYNVYESDINYFGVVPAGVTYGFIGTCKGTTFIDTNIIPDFTETPPVGYDPFTGNGLGSITVTAPGTYTTVPGVGFSGGTPSIPGTATAILGVNAVPTITSGGTGFAVGDTVNFGNSLVLTVSAVTSGAITAWTIANPGNISSGSVPTSPIAQISSSGTGTGATATATWGVVQAIVLTRGAGYTAAPSVVFSAGAATATAALGASASGNPGVASFFQQRLVLAAPAGAPSTFYMSQPGLYFNFDITDPVQGGNSITETLVSRNAEQIKSIVSSTSGMLVLTDQGSWLVNGGSSGSAVSPSAIVANRQSGYGANDVPPIVANYDVLYVGAKGSSVRDLAYNIYFNVFTGTDISITSSHLFFNYQITEWAWAEAPFYVAWAVRNDGVMLTLTLLKEQEFTGWTHQVTPNGLYKSVCVVTESTAAAGNVDAVYTVVQRTINGASVKYIERITDRVFPNGLSSAWCVDAGLQYQGPATLTFQGAEHLAGQSVTGLATDNTGNVTVVSQFTMPVSGIFTLPAPTAPGSTGYTTVTIGLGYACKLQTLGIDVSSPPIQGKLKKIQDVVVRVNDTVGLAIGSSFDNLVVMKDTVIGNVSSMLTGLDSQSVTGLYSGDARTFLDPTYNVPGQYCIQQSNPYPATILGVFPNLVMGDTD